MTAYQTAIFSWEFLTSFCGYGTCGYGIYDRGTCGCGICDYGTCDCETRDCATFYGDYATFCCETAFCAVSAVELVFLTLLHRCLVN